MKTISDIGTYEGVKALVRADFNVPIQNGSVVDDFRIRMALPTINFLTSKGAKVILMSHIESSDGTAISLKPVADSLNKLGITTTFIPNMRNAFGVIEAQENGSCVLIENLRYFEGEKANDQKFAKELASLGDVYINEAFPACHREHASIVSVPKYIPGFAGLQLEKEILNLSRVFEPSHPFLFILGGAKFGTKLPLLNKFLKNADTVFVGGALANDFFKAKGYEVGVSLLSKGDFDFKPLLSNSKLMMPTDVVTQDHKNKSADTVLETDKILDAGSATLSDLKKVIEDAKFILWNGPLGLYEDGYQGATIELAKMVASVPGVTTIIGGGDTVAAVAASGVEDKMTFVSTGGGAMLDFLAQGTLPGIEALKASASNH